MKFLSSFRGKTTVGIAGLLVLSYVVTSVSVIQESEGI